MWLWWSLTCDDAGLGRRDPVVLLQILGQEHEVATHVHLKRQGQRQGQKQLVTQDTLHRPR